MPLNLVLPNSTFPPFPNNSPHLSHPWLQLQKQRPMSLGISCISTRFRRKPGTRKTENSEAHELVRVLVRSFSDKEPLLKSLNKYVRIVRTEHCFLLFEELGKTDKWLQCLEVSHHFSQIHFFFISMFSLNVGVWKLFNVFSAFCGRC